MWHRSLFDGYIHEHDDCPTFAALKPRHMATIALVAEARRVEAELSKSVEKAGDSNAALETCCAHWSAESPPMTRQVWQPTRLGFLTRTHRHCPDTRARRQSLQPSMHLIASNGRARFFKKMNLAGRCEP